jgi:hypothetical protein
MGYFRSAKLYICFDSTKYYWHRELIELYSRQMLYWANYRSTGEAVAIGNTQSKVYMKA